MIQLVSSHSSIRASSTMYVLMRIWIMGSSGVPQVATMTKIRNGNIVMSPVRNKMNTLFYRF